MADDCSNPSDSDSPDAVPESSEQKAGDADENVEEISQGQWEGEIQRVQGIQGELRRLSTVRFVDLEHLASIFQWFDEMRQIRGCGRLEGVSQVGKTVAARVYAMRYRRKPGDEGPQTVTYVRLPPGAGLGEWYGRLVESLGGEPMWGTLSQQRRQGLALCRERSLRLAIVDNADQQSPKLLQEVRYLSERLWTGAVLIGGQKLSDRLDRDRDLATAFQPLYWMPKLNEDGLKQAIEKWEVEVLQLPERSHLEEEGAFEMVREITQGCVGRLDVILRRSAMRALKAGKHAIDRDVLDEVVQDYR
ncbi:MAG: TniB family NTP-binding protein [Cyanobacteria bacterium P01_F01_bin.153]